MFEVIITSTSVWAGYDIHVHLDGTRYYLGFATKNGKSGYTFTPLAQQFADNVQQAVFTLKKHSLTAAEVKNQAHILAGLFIADPSNASGIAVTQAI